MKPLVRERRRSTEQELKGASMVDKTNVVPMPATGPNLVRAFEQTALIEWEPQQARHREALAEAVKAYARAVHDWDLLDRAVEQQISDQRNLVEWWDKHVQPAGGSKRGHANKGGRGPDKQPRRSKVKVADRG
jgi:hypothetical protein